MSNYISEKILNFYKYIIVTIDKCVYKKKIMNAEIGV